MGKEPKDALKEVGVRVARRLVKDTPVVTALRMTPDDQVQICGELTGKVVFDLTMPASTFNDLFEKE